LCFTAFVRFALALLTAGQGIFFILSRPGYASSGFTDIQLLRCYGLPYSSSNKRNDCDIGGSNCILSLKRGRGKWIKKRLCNRKWGGSKCRLMVLLL